MGFEAIILQEQADGGLTIIEKIEKYTDVVFEQGYLMGKLGRK